MPVYGALNPNQPLLYDSKKGALMYDADGPGSAAAVTIAVLSNPPRLAARDSFLT